MESPMRGVALNPDVRDALLDGDGNVLLVLSKLDLQPGAPSPQDFFGQVVDIAELPDLNALPSLTGKTVYLWGDINSATPMRSALADAHRVFVVRQLCVGFEGEHGWTVIDWGRLPLDVHGAGVFYPRFFDDRIDYFDQITNEHEFQNLTESNKPGKESDTPVFEVLLAHNSVVLWSLDTNRRFKHKIVLKDTAAAPDNEWLGLTFRTSKTFVQFRDGQATLADGSPLVLVGEEDERARDFYRLRGRENRESDFVWPALGYTLCKRNVTPPERD